MLLLTQFLLRLAFGLAAGMAILPARQVASGYFRNHLYVTMALAALAALMCRALGNAAFWPAVAAGVASYIGAVAWLYEKPVVGKAALFVVAVAALAGASLATGLTANATARNGLAIAQVFVSGAVLGITMAAMLLGHWYLNSPGMRLAPLRRLLVAAAVVVSIHAVFCGTGLGLELQTHSVSTQWWLLVALRWSFGLLGVVILVGMAWRTLDVPNTQSATGILYVAVIGTFVGETMSLLLSAESVYPV